MTIEHPSDCAQDLIAELGRKYIWWTPIGDKSHSEERIIAQAMNLGTFDDIRRLEKTLGRCRAALDIDVLRCAAAEPLTKAVEQRRASAATAAKDDGDARWSGLERAHHSPLEP